MLIYWEELQTVGTHRCGNEKGLLRHAEKCQVKEKRLFHEATGED
jgi:hypothetical protein